MQSSSASAGTKKRRKRAQGEPTDCQSKNNGHIPSRSVHSLVVNGQSLQSAVPLSREERKNEQILRMFERQEKLRLRKEQKKQGIQVSDYYLNHNLL